MYRSRLISDSFILNNLLEKPQKIRGWGNRIIGYGLSGSDFDKFDNCSRSLFNQRKANFLASKIIKPLKAKGKKIKYYSITPLGIARLFQNATIDLHQFNKALEFVFRFDEESWMPWDEVSAQTWGEFDSKLIKKILRLTDKKLLFKIMKSVLIDIRIVEDESNYIIYLTQTLPKETNCVLWKFTIIDNIVYINFDPKNEYRKPKKISDEEFYASISEHVLYSFHFSLYEKLKGKNIPDEYREELEEISGGHGLVIMDSTATSLEKLGIEI